MKIFIFGSELTPKPVLFSQYNWAVNFNFDELNAYEQEHQEAASLQLVNDREAELKNADLIVIELVDNNEDLCLNIGHRIRFLEATRTQPIVYFGKKNISEIMKRDPFLSIILFTKGTAYLESTENSEDIKSTLTRLESEASNFSDFKAFDESFLKKIRIPEPEDLGRHSIANQWGAFRFAQVADLELASLEFSPRLFFQYLTVGLQENEIRKIIKEEQEKRTKLIIEANNNIPQNVIPKVNRVLLIDDNHDKGWSLVLSRLFSKWNENTETCLDTYKSYSSECQTALRNGDYDFVLLDFYFGENDTKGKGLDTLKAIKEINPVLPVIMFTASNKAWNMDALYEAGADGYYIKEHPDTASDADFSVNNFNNFIKTIDRCRKKGKLLKPYWQALKGIRALFSAEQGPVKEKTLSDGSRSDFRGRISERITMFIGLLKKAYEQTAFDEKAFFYSDYELAFLTLWSVLNELQESFFEKDQPNVSITDRNGENQTRHITHPKQPLISYFNFPFKKHFRWKFQGKTFLTYRYFVKRGDNDPEFLPRGYFNLYGEERSNFYLDLNNQKYGFAENSRKGDVPYSITLHMQIAFLLIVMNNESELPSVLLRLNEVRNKLFLTHGGNSNSPEFERLYSQDREPDEDWNTRIKDLFSIVYFLCTATEWNPDERPAEPQS